jgi:hypothetical protein
MTTEFFSPIAIASLASPDGLLALAKGQDQNGTFFDVPRLEQSPWHGHRSASI